MPTARNTSAQSSSVLTRNLKSLYSGPQPEMSLHCFSSSDLSCHSGLQHHRGKHLGFPSDSIFIHQGDEEYRFLKHMQCLHVFCLYFYYAMCTHHHLGNWYRYFLELRERGGLWITSFSKRDHAEWCSNCSQGWERYLVGHCCMAEAFLPHPGQSLYLENYTVKINQQLTI